MRVSNLTMPRSSSSSINIEGSYMWDDLIGHLTPKTAGGGAAAWAQFRAPAAYGWVHSATTTGQIQYHKRHNYAPGTDIELHVHWGHNGTSVSGTFAIDFWLTYAKAHQQGADSIFPVGVQTQISVTSLNIATSPQYCHRTDRIFISIAGGSASKLDTNKLEPDGIIMGHYAINTLPTITGSVNGNNKPYIFSIDAHVQDRGIGTINCVPNFYGA